MSKKINKKDLCDSCNNEAFLNIRGRNYCPNCLKEKRRNNRYVLLGEAIEKAFMQEAPELTFEPITKICIRSIEELLEWAERAEKAKEFEGL